ncbi:hypothetical protein DNL40_10095, partial [Xylanimonas oleitrophica]
MAGFAVPVLALLGSGALGAGPVAADEPDPTQVTEQAPEGSDDPAPAQGDPATVPDDGSGQGIEGAEGSAPAPGAEGPAGTSEATAATDEPVPAADAADEPAPAADAAVTEATPVPAAGQPATVVVHVGGDRAGDGGVSGLAGVTLGLFPSEGATAPVAAPWATATSDAAGVVTFTVPAEGTGTAYWVKGISGSGAYTLNPSLATAPITNPTSDTARTYAFQTPQLQQGGTYESGKDFMRQGGTNDYASSTGTWAPSRSNPDLPEQCGLDVALVVDLSASVLQANATQDLRRAATSYANALLGTPSRVQLISFGTTATTVSGLTSVSTQAGVDGLTRSINTLQPQSSSYTNWDGALRTVRQQDGAFDLAVVITDGNPTVLGDGSAGRNTRLAEVEAGIFSANALKSEGTHVLAMGVGDAVRSKNAALNLQAISGPDDFVQAADYEALAQELRDRVFERCAPSLTVVKQVAPADGGPAAPAAGWTFDASGDAVSATGTTDGTGAVNFPVTSDAGSGRTPVTVTERQQPGYTLQQQDGSNAVCTVKNKDNPLGTTLGVENTGTDGFTLSMGSGDMVSCTVVNAAPAELSTTVTADPTFERDYDWGVSKQVKDADGTWVDATERRSRPHTAQAFDYRVVVTPQGPQDSGYRVHGTVTVTNPNASAVPLTAVDVTVGGVPATVEIPDGATVPAGGQVEVPFTATMPQGTTAGTTAEVVATASWGDVTTPPATTEVAFAGVRPTETDRTVVVEDTAPELAQAYSLEERTLDATQGEQTFTYSRDLGAELGAGETGEYPNTASIPPTSDQPEQSDDADVTVRTGRDLLVEKAVAAQLHRTYAWSLEKDVVGDDVKEAGEDGTATFSYRVTATPGAATDSGWAMDGTITVSNPNPWPVDATAADLPELGEGVTCTVDGGTAQVPAAGPDGPGTTTFGYTCLFDGKPDLDGANVATVTWDPEQASSAHGTASHSVDVTEATWDKTVENETVTVVDDKTVEGQEIVLGQATWNPDGTPTTFTYDLTVDGPQEPATERQHTNTTWLREVPPIRDEETVTVLERPAYDLALREWVGELYRDGQLVSARNPDADDPGPDYDVPYAAFDKAGVDVRVGDVLVHDLHLFNQGNRPARVEELVDYLPEGLALATPEQLATVPGEDNTGWEPRDGKLFYTPAGDGIVIEPGHEAEVRLVLQVTEAALPTQGDDHRDVTNFAEISRFSGLVVTPQAEPQPASPFAASLRRLVPDHLFAAVSPLAAATPLAAPAGTWEQVADVDSRADAQNYTLVDGVVRYDKYENNEVDEHDTTDEWDTPVADVDNDEDDHDGNVVRVLSAVVPPTQPDEPGTPQQPATPQDPANPAAPVDPTDPTAPAVGGATEGSRGPAAQPAQQPAWWVG